MLHLGATPFHAWRLEEEDRQEAVARHMHNAKSTRTNTAPLLMIREMVQMGVVFLERLDNPNCQKGTNGKPVYINGIECLADFGHGNTNVARRGELARNQRQRLQAPTLV